MSISLMSAAWKLDIPPTQKFVLVALCDCANDSGECYPSVSNLVKKTGFGERTVQSAIAYLEADNLLKREFRDGRSTVYWLTIQDDQPAQQPHPRSNRTPAAPAPTPAAPAPPPPQLLHPEPSIEPLLEPSKEPSQKRHSEKKTKSVISPDWFPSERCKELLADAGIDESFWKKLIGEFVLYWDERQEKRAGWDSTFLAHAKRQAEQVRQMGVPKLQGNFSFGHQSKADAQRERNKASLDAFAKRIMEQENAIN